MFSAKARGVHILALEESLFPIFKEILELTVYESVNAFSSLSQANRVQVGI